MSDKSRHPHHGPPECPECALREETLHRLSERCRLQRLFIESIFDLMEDRGIINANPTLADLFKIFKDEDSLDRALARKSAPEPKPEENSKILDLNAIRKRKLNT